MNSILPGRLVLSLVAVLLGPSRVTWAEGIPPLTQLSAAQSLLQVVNDQMRGSKSLAKRCGLSVEDAKNRQLALHPLLASKARQVAKKFEDSWVTGWSEQCEENCRCLAYVAVLDRLSPERIAKLPPEPVSSIRAAASRITPEARMKCARSQVWICREPWFKTLALEAREFEEIDADER